MSKTKENRTRAAIIAAVERHLEQSETLTFSLEQIAQDAGLSKGGLLYHFKTKESILEALVQHFCENFDERTLALTQMGVSYAKAYIQVSLQPETIRSFRLILAVCASNQKLLLPLQKPYQDWHARLKEDLQNEQLAYGVRLIVDGYLLSAVGSFQVPRKDEVLALISTLLSAAGHRN
jgi:AcrR family transcriptional regulator